MLIRDDRFIGWRYSLPSRGYRLSSLVDQGACVALGVTAPRRLLGRDMLLLVDLMVPPGRSDMLKSLVATAYGDARSIGAAAIMTYLSPNSPLVAPLLSSGFWNIPSFLRPRPYSIWAAGDPEGRSSRRLFDLDAWHMTLADSDLA